MLQVHQVMRQAKVKLGTVKVQIATSMYLDVRTCSLKIEFRSATGKAWSSMKKEGTIAGAIAGTNWCVSGFDTLVA